MIETSVMKVLKVYSIEVLSPFHSLACGLTITLQTLNSLITNVPLNIKSTLVVYGIICKTSMETTFGILNIIFRGTQMFGLESK